MLKRPVLASNIQHLTDARYFAAYQVDFLCFPMDGEGKLDPAHLAGIADWVEGPQIAVEYLHTSLDNIQQLQQDLDISFVKISNDLYPDWHSMDWGNARLLLDINLGFSNPNIWNMENVEALIISSPSQIQAPDLLPFTDTNTPVFININHQNFHILWDTFGENNNIGYCLEGAKEEKVGYKSFEQMDPIIELLEHS